MLAPRTIIGELHKVTIADVKSDCSDIEFLGQFNLEALDLPDDDVSSITHLLLEHKDGFSPTWEELPLQ